MEAGKCVALLVNKWDLAIDKFRANQPDEFENMEGFRRAYAASALRELFFLPDSPVLFVSALRGFSMDKVLNQARALWETSGRTLPTPKVNALVHGLIEKKQPRFIDNKRFKAYYAVQTGNRPFRFKLFCNRATKLDDGYRRYLQNGFIKNFKLQGCPVQFELKGKEKRYADSGKKGSRR
jgi:GTP-binding protein